MNATMNLAPWENLVGAAKDVNQRKADRLPHEAGLKLLSVPCPLRRLARTALFLRFVLSHGASATKELPVTAHLRNAHGVAEWKLFLNE